MTFYPRVLTEAETVARAHARGLSIVLLRQDEMHLAGSQSAMSPRSVAEFRDMLWAGHSNALICIPRQRVGPNAELWSEFARPSYVHLCGNQAFGSSFSFAVKDAPWIDSAQHWQNARDLWRGCRPRFISYLDDPAADHVIDAAEADIGEPETGVLIAAGWPGAILAWRLAQKGVRAIHVNPECVQHVLPVAA